MEAAASATPRKRFDLLSVVSSLGGETPRASMVRAMDPFPRQPPPIPPRASTAPGPRRPRPEITEDADPIKRRPQALPPPPQRWIEYVSPLVHASRTAYMAAPPDVRAALDLLLSVPDFWRISRNAWSGSVGVWTREGLPSERGNAVLRKTPRLEGWIRSLRSQSWQPWEEGRQFLTPEDMEQLGVAAPEPVEGLPEILLRRRSQPLDLCDPS